MKDTYRDELEVTLQRAHELEQANTALAARNAALQGPNPPPPAPPPLALAKRNSNAAGVLFATGVLAVLVLFAVSPIAGGVGFIFLIAVPFALGMLRLVQWLEKHGLD